MGSEVKRLAKPSLSFWLERLEDDSALYWGRFAEKQFRAGREGASGVLWARMLPRALDTDSALSPGEAVSEFCS